MQHRAVAVRQQEAIAVRPARIRRVVTQVARPQRDGDFRHAHRHSRMSRLRLFDGVHRERANRVRKLVIGRALFHRTAVRRYRGIGHDFDVAARGASAAKED